MNQVVAEQKDVDDVGLMGAHLRGCLCAWRRREHDQRLWCVETFRPECRVHSLPSRVFNPHEEIRSAAQYLRVVSSSPRMNEDFRHDLDQIARGLERALQSIGATNKDAPQTEGRWTFRYRTNLRSWLNILAVRYAESCEGGQPEYQAFLKLLDQISGADFSQLLEHA